ncbi:hypothetical protein FCH28_23715 [Streptomyces piniterrae]|uniref:Subtilisin inhibitor domain-containing protein n=1 Tax=Streptomyces piniterrae TaxID=2571125 RepID=A0A4V5MJQ9_9ACTN|nr:SSI family serine proteinase inhibitor [Streptomyces piniterrae]TJZ50298.1 hypothetical protein FCH28_23715 [Streptomyces piniterrae]
MPHLRTSRRTSRRTFRRTSRFGAAATTAAAVVSAASALATAAPAASASPIPLPERRAAAGRAVPTGDLPMSGDHLTVTVAHSGDPKRDGTRDLYCHPTGGDHPEAKAACDGLDEVTTWGKDPFAPTSPNSQCTMIYGGPATAHVVGRWAGREVDARFDRSDGCEIHRWERVQPLLPRTTLWSSS